MSRCYVGDCRAIMRRLIDRGMRIQTCVTSPPYYGLRDYGHIKQLGLEKTPDEYVANMVGVFRLVRELLADDGTLWLNLGDSYARQAGDDATRGRPNTGQARIFENGLGREGMGNNRPPPGLKAKDLIGIPWRVAFALQADGWYLRQDIIWHKPNPMPESVTDRCTKAHEHIFLMSRSSRYYFDAEAIKEPAIYAGKTIRTNGNDGMCAGYDRHRTRDGLKRGVVVKETRNRRSVWIIATKPYKGAHFATFPPALVEPCILAGSREGDIVLDPFFGSGTVGQVAKRHGRQWIGCEINREYMELQRNRIKGAR